MQVLLAQPRGFCAGVVRAIEIVERALERFGPPVYVRHEIVHNRHVVESLRAKGAVFVEELYEVPAGAITIFSAHGVSRAVRGRGQARGLHVIDATCPLVSKVHNQGSRYAGQGREVVLIGHAGHPEVEGTHGPGSRQAAPGRKRGRRRRARIPRDKPLAYITQTTLSVDDTRGIIAALKARFSGPARARHARHLLCDAEPPDGRARDLAARSTSCSSSARPTARTRTGSARSASRTGTPSYLVGFGSDIDPEWLAEAERIGITAGASAPETLVDDVIDALGRHCGKLVVVDHGGARREHPVQAAARACRGGGARFLSPHPANLQTPPGKWKATTWEFRSAR